MAAPTKAFPRRGVALEAPTKHGVYVITGRSGTVVNVGRTHRGRNGLLQRLTNHLRAQSSFVLRYLGADGNRLRDGFKFQCLEVRNPRKRALLEYFATGKLCPKHLGVGLKSFSGE